jgi:transcriptional regulator with XRE-family HTH domain
MNKPYDFAHILGNNVRILRKRRKLSQLDLALKADLSQTFINNIENEKKGVSLESLSNLCEALEIYPYQLFLTDDVPGLEAGYTAIQEKQNLLFDITEVLSKYQREGE